MSAFDSSFGTIDIEGGLHGIAGGSDETVVLLHGWPATSRSWRAVMPLLTEAGYRVLAVDTPGLGESAASSGGYSKRALAEAIHNDLARHGVTRFHLAGHDLGGQIAYALAQLHPDAVASLAILEIVLAGHAGWADLPVWHFGFHQVPGLAEALTAGRERVYLDFFYTAHLGRAGAITEADKEDFVAAYARPDAMRRGFEYYRAFSTDEADNKHWLTEGRMLPMPVLWLGGALSLGDLLAAQLKPVARDLQGAVIPGAGHWLPLEDPEAVARYLLALYRRMEGRG